MPRGHAVLQQALDKDFLLGFSNRGRKACKHMTRELLWLKLGDSLQ